MSTVKRITSAAVSGVMLISAYGTAVFAADKCETSFKADISQYDSSMSLVSYSDTGLNTSGTTPEAESRRIRLRDISPTLSANPAMSRVRSEEIRPSEVASKIQYVGTKSAPQRVSEINADHGQFAFVTYGWGHGVGMSQNGANFYATYAGWDYSDILFHYYPDTYLVNTEIDEEEELTIAHEYYGTPIEVIAGIVFNEVGSSFNFEAIKAQAVAVYTYIRYNGNDSHDLRAKPDPPQIVIDACEAVYGEALFYNDNYALTMFSASCGGCSANSYEVFYANLPYLRSVPSDYDEAYDPHWGTVTYMDAEEVKQKIEEKYEVILSGNPENWIQPVYSPTTGYVTEVNIDGQKTVKGYPFSYDIGLKSGKFNVTYTP